MGRYTFPCPQCGQSQTRRTAAEESAPVHHNLCATCAEKEAGAKEEKLGKAPHR